MADILIDIWTGEFSQTLSSSRVLSMEEALKLAEFELKSGNLVNLRQNTNNITESFDERQKQ